MNYKPALYTVGYRLDDGNINMATLLHNGKKIGACCRSKTGEYWVARHRKGHLLYFSNPIPIAYGILNGEYFLNAVIKRGST